MEVTREQALALLQKYNQEPFHILHALTVEGVMRWYAQQEGEDADFWGLCGLLHDVDFERYPEQHCVKAPELLAEINASPEMVHAICSHGYGLCCDVEPTHEMEKILFAADELTGLIGAAARMRPSKSVMDMEDALAGAHPGGCADQAGQLVGGKENLLHFVSRLHVTAQAVAVGANGVNHLRTGIDLSQQLRRLDAVLLGVAFKVHVVEKTAQTPEVRVFALLLRIPAHNALNGQGVENVKRLLIVFLQQGKRLLPCYFHKNTSCKKFATILRLPEIFVNEKKRPDPLKFP